MLGRKFVWYFGVLWSYSGSMVMCSSSGSGVMSCIYRCGGVVRGHGCSLGCACLVLVLSCRWGVAVLE